VSEPHTVSAPAVGCPGSWIKTFTGKRFDVLNPDPDQICIEDIAHALSNQCRYGGHSRKFYSVAEHSIYVAMMCSWYNKLAGLLHDASEAYLVDIPRPIKHNPYLAGYRELEAKVQDAISLKFNAIGTPDIKRFDNEVLRYEIYQLMNDPEDYGLENPHTEIVLPCWSPTEAKEKFLERFKKLSNPFNH
jgi:hypothetical protein